MDYKEITDKLINLAYSYGLKIILSLVVLIIGLWIIKRIVKLIRRLLKKGKTDPSLHTFVASLTDITLKILLIISVAGMLGIQTTSFIALIGAAGLAIGMSLQGALQNFAGGVLILIFRPFKVNDFIEAQGILGTVKEIQILNTIILTPENKTVIIPNGNLSNGVITNYTKEGIIRVDMVFGISYDSDIKKAKNTLLQLLKDHPKVLKEPEPFVGVLELADSSVNLAVRPYTKPEDYWNVYFDIYEQGKEALDKQNITIPFPQMDIHLDK